MGALRLSTVPGPFLASRAALELFTSSLLLLLSAQNSDAMSTAMVDQSPPTSFPSGLHRPASPAVEPAQAQPAGVPTTVAYCDPPSDGREIYMNIAAKEGEERTNFVEYTQEVFVNDLRQADRPFALHQHGFQLERFEVPDGIDWSNEEEVKTKYWPLAAELIKRAAGATRVHVFDTTVRNGKVKSGAEALQDRGTDIRAPVPRVHVDYTVRSGPARLHEVLPDEADILKKTPFAVIQVWRPLKGPVDEAPLAVVDAQTLNHGDLLQVRLQFPHRTGYTYTIKHDPAHKFYYAKGMTTEEALVFKCYDSRKGTARFGPHTSFKDPNTPADAPPRQSIELRAYAFFEDQPEQAIQTEL